MFGPNGILYLLGAAIIGALIAYMKGRLSGARLERDKQIREEAKARDVADQIDEAVAGRDPDINRKELKKWGR